MGAEEDTAASADDSEVEPTLLERTLFLGFSSKVNFPCGSSIVVGDTAVDEWDDTPLPTMVHPRHSWREGRETDKKSFTIQLMDGNAA
mmetsp:Transcript_40922/g.85846  ORF Transcript_40922/g.85846 Transcript_40922/m.85846 type:complete len:88 (+) Transcript_40922:2126-2389(+)